MNIAASEIPYRFPPPGDCGGEETVVIPRVETERLVLREWRLEDFEPFAALMADPEVTRFLNGEPLSRADAWRSMAMGAGHWSLRGYGFWAVERKSDRAFLGRVGLHFPEGWPALEVGWSLGRAHWGNGYATEAARASLDYGFLTQPVARLISLIDPSNKASQAVAIRLGETCGARREVAFGGKTFAADEWSISREAWARRAAGCEARGTPG